MTRPSLPVVVAAIAVAAALAWLLGGWLYNTTPRPDRRAAGEIDTGPARSDATGPAATDPADTDPADADPADADPADASANEPETGEAGPGGGGPAIDQLAEAGRPAEPAAAVGTTPRTGEIVAPASRDVTPPGVTRGPEVTGPLVRIEPVRPDPPAGPPPPEDPVKLFRIRIEADGRFVAGSAKFRLAGITLSAPETLCGGGAAQWPCGRMAVAQLRRLVGSRAIDCDRAAGRSQPDDPARCRLGQTDLSEWMVKTGWARAADPAFAELEDKARAAGLGQWSRQRP